MDPMPPPEDVVDRLAAVALALPQTRQEDAWRGVRWRVRQKTFAHVLMVVPDRPSAYAEATGEPGPALTLTFHAVDEDLAYFASAGLPYYKPPWSPTVVGVVLDDPRWTIDWDEVAELVTDSYRACAPQKLARTLD